MDDYLIRTIVDPETGEILRYEICTLEAVIKLADGEAIASIDNLSDYLGAPTIVISRFLSQINKGLREVLPSHNPPDPLAADLFRKATDD